MLQVTGYVMRVSPLAVFGALAASITREGPGVLLTYGELVGEFYIALLLLWTLLLLHFSYAPAPDLGHCMRRAAAPSL